MAFRVRALLISAMVVVASLVLLAQDTVSSRRFTTSDGIRLHYLERGRGDAIVFVPGWTMPARIWDRQLDGLGTTHRVLALDPRNQGESARTTEGNFPERRATDVHELIAQAGAGRVVLVGWSLGVREILTYARLFGTGTLRGLVLVDGEVWTPMSEERRRTQAAFMHDLETRRPAFTAEFVRRMFATPQPEPYLAGLVRESLAVPTSAAVSMLTDLYLQNDMREVVASLAVPVLVITRAAHADQGDVVKRALPGAEVDVFEHAGHALFVDEADRFNRRIDAFLTALDKRERMGR